VLSWWRLWDIHRFELLENGISELDALLVAPDYDGLVSEPMTIFPFEERKYEKTENGQLHRVGNFIPDFTVQVQSEILKMAGIDEGYLGEKFKVAEHSNGKFPEIKDRLNIFINFSLADKKDELSYGVNKDGKFLFTVNINGVNMSPLNKQDHKGKDFIIKILLADRLQRDQNILQEEPKNSEMVVQDRMVGIITEAKYYLRVYQNGYVGSNVLSHADEDTNQNPEPFVEGNYTTILPDGEVSILHNESEICDSINEQRRAGCALQINPRWFWLRNKDGDLFIPKNRFEFSEFREVRDKVMETGSSITDQELYKCFMEFLYFDTAPSLNYAAGESDLFGDIKKDIHEQYEKYRAKRLVDLKNTIEKLTEDVLREEIGTHSDMADMISVFMSLRGRETSLVQNSPVANVCNPELGVAIDKTPLSPVK
jgi:hypothetical protein